jgi:aspartate aminotransferase
VNGLSKGFAMTGWRIGFARGPRPWIDGIRQLATQAGGGLCWISQAAAIAALMGPKDFMAGWRQQYRRRRDLALRGLAKTNRLSASMPEGAFYLFSACSGVHGLATPNDHVIRSSGDFARYLIEDWGVVVPGVAFSSDPYVRLSIATSEAIIADGVERIVQACNALSRNGADP